MIVEFIMQDSCFFICRTPYRLMNPLNRETRQNTHILALHFHLKISIVCNLNNLPNILTQQEGLEFKTDFA